VRCSLRSEDDEPGRSCAAVADNDNKGCAHALLRATWQDDGGAVAIVADVTMLVGANLHQSFFDRIANFGGVFQDARCEREQLRERQGADDLASAMVFGADVMPPIKYWIGPIRIFQAELLGVLRGQAERSLERLSRPLSFVERVETSLRRQPLGGIPDMKPVARELGLSVRSLRRRLDEEGTSFRAANSPNIGFAGAH
jgi:AraC-like DNA-binding protein